MGTILIPKRKETINTEPHKFVPDLSQRLDLRSSNKHVALQTCLFINSSCSCLHQ